MDSRPRARFAPWAGGTNPVFRVEPSNRCCKACVPRGIGNAGCQSTHISVFGGTEPPGTGTAIFQGCPPGAFSTGHQHHAPNLPPIPPQHCCSAPRHPEDPPDLAKFLLLQVPFLYAVVPGATEEDVPLDGQALDAVVVRGLEVVSGADIAHHALGNLKHLGEKKKNSR